MAAQQARRKEEAQAGAGDLSTRRTKDGAGSPLGGGRPQKETGEENKEGEIKGEEKPKRDGNKAKEKNKGEEESRQERQGLKTQKLHNCSAAPPEGAPQPGPGPSPHPWHPGGSQEPLGHTAGLPPASPAPPALIGRSCRAARWATPTHLCSTKKEAEAPESPRAS